MTLALIILLQVDGSPPREFLEAERFSRRAIEAFGVSTEGVKMRYDFGPPPAAKGGGRVTGNQLGDRITIYVRGGEDALKSVPHEFWHYFQMQGYGGRASFGIAYDKADQYFGDLAARPRFGDRLVNALRGLIHLPAKPIERDGWAQNPFEIEARKAGELIENTYRTQGSWFYRLKRVNYEERIQRTFDRNRGEFDEIWRKARDAGVEPLHLKSLPRPNSPRAIAKREIKRELAGLAQYAAAYLLKEGFKAAVESRDVSDVKDAAMQMKDWRFWSGVAGFSVIARGVELGVGRVPMPLMAKGLSKAILPMAVAMAVLQAVSGRFSPRDVAIDTGSYVAAGLAVNLLADTLFFSASPAGWVGGVVKLAASLYVGEKLSGWLHGRLSGGEEPGSAPRQGLKQRIDGLGE
ncbi:MAG: hypothetical protein HYY16_19970 [Planctomycetes bacterium]|nr:hypothetical protein [Planctomycetota bacterium]